MKYKIKHILYLHNSCKIIFYCCIVLCVHVVCAKFHKNLALTIPVTHWRILGTLNRFLISQKWKLAMLFHKTFQLYATNRYVGPEIKRHQNMTHPLSQLHNRIRYAY